MKVIMRVLFLAGTTFSFFLFYKASQYLLIHDMGVLHPKGVIAYKEMDLMIIATGLMLLIIIPVFLMLFGFAWRYRAGNTRATYRPDWHTNIALEITWWAIPTVIVIVLSIITWKSTHDLEPSKAIAKDLEPITIQVVALDWKWLFIYPKENIATVNYIVFPKDTPLHFVVTSDAPMNAFWIPQLGSQVYAMAGMSSQLYLMADKEGRYKGMSSNFSGEGFSGMTFVAEATSSEAYLSWVREVRATDEVLSQEEYKKLLMPSKHVPVALYGQVPDALYDTIIMKYMAPHALMNDMGYAH